MRIRVDGDKVVLDVPEIPQKLRRKPPARAWSTRPSTEATDELKKWTPRRATIISLSRRDSAFGPTLNFDVTLRLDDGTGAHAAKSEIPFYAAWLAAPGAEVPVVVDGGRAVIDWAAAANEPNRPAGGPDDPPPPGSAATRY